MSTFKLSSVDLLTKLVPDRSGDIKPGRLESSSLVITDPARALKGFVEFGGEGWLCITSSSDIIRFSTSSPIDVNGGWPISGEAVKDKESLHLQRCDGGWELVSISWVEPKNPYDMVISNGLIAKGGGRLRYETYWELTDVAGQEELRPVGFRFVGFEPKKEG